MSKRGISPLIATVMLVGFAVALGAMVSTYLIKEAKDFKPESFLEDSPFCEGVVLEPVVVDLPSGVSSGGCSQTIPNNPNPRNWPKSTLPPLPSTVLFAPADPNRGQCSDPARLSTAAQRAANICLVHGIGFRNKGAFSIHSVLVSGTGLSNQPVLPITANTNPPRVEKLGPSKIWGVLASSSVAEFRNPTIPYLPVLPTESRILKITPRVVDPEKTQENGGTPVIIPCPKQEISIDLAQICPCCR